MRSQTWPLLVALLLSSGAIYAQQTDYEKWKAEHMQRYDSFSAAYLKRYDAYKLKIQQQWGTGTELSNQHSYVVYSDDLSQKTVVDFSRQEIRVEVLAGQNDMSAENMQQQGLALVNQSVSALAAIDPLLHDVRHFDTRTLAQALLPDVEAEQLLSVVNVSTEEIGVDIPDIAPKALSNNSPSHKSASSKRVKRVTIKLDGKDLYQRRALQYQPQTELQAEKYGLDSALLLAIMQVESSFNPLAQSPVPAFGLMQIVPESAGIDVNTRFFKKKRPPSAELLFKPDDNILFGSAYFNILDKHYLSAISDPTSRLYCAIAAYNTGAGNVASVFHPKGEKRISEAVKVINTLTPAQVYQRLLIELPYEETRKYLEKVTTAIPHYQQ